MQIPIPGSGWAWALPAFLTTLWGCWFASTLSSKDLWSQPARQKISRTQKGCDGEHDGAVEDGKIIKTSLAFWKIEEMGKYTQNDWRHKLLFKVNIHFGVRQTLPRKKVWGGVTYTVNLEMSRVEKLSNLVTEIKGKKEWAFWSWSHRESKWKGKW